MTHIPFGLSLSKPCPVFYLRAVSFWADLLYCNAGRFYAGHTDNLERRIAQHEAGTIRGYTRAYRPVTLVWSQEFASRTEALEAEHRIKGWSRPKKLALIRGDWDEISRLAKKGSASTSSARTEGKGSEPNPAPIANVTTPSGDRP